VTPVPARGHPLWVENPLPAAALATDRILLLATPVGPGLAALVMLSSGLVCASAAITGHAVILAREVGIACIIGVSALGQMREASIIELLPDSGLVRAIWI
jgi:phosphohistidine swiveling domain-containing protein